MPPPASPELRRHARIVEGLRDPAAYPHRVDGVEVIETHISTVLLAGEFAYKLKKPVNLGFADFSTPELRRRYCEEEIRLNRRGAPSLYLDVVAIGGDPEHPRVAAAPGGAPIEHAVRMRRFEPECRLDRVATAGLLGASHVDLLARSVAAYHAQAAPSPAARGFGEPALVGRWAQGNFPPLESAGLQGEDRAILDELRAWTRREFGRREALLARRRREGHVRECHGDMHLANLVLLDGVPVPFDCIEFNDELRFIDTANDIAFTFMDLVDHGLEPLAWRFLGAYLEISGDYEGLGTLRFYAVYRALVRAKIAWIRGGQDGTPPAEREQDIAALRRYLRVAQAIANPAPAWLIATAGVTGSGKTTVARMLAGRLGAAWVRSDLERKRLLGLAATDHSAAGAGPGESIYAEAETARTYARLGELAATILDADTSAIVDATFLRRRQRDALRDIARDRGAPFLLVECEAPHAVLEGRIERRRTAGEDASDATPAILAHQLATREPLLAQEREHAVRLDTDCDADGLEARCAAIANRIRARR